GHEAADLVTGGGDPRFIRALEHVGRHDGHEQADDRDDHQHFNQGHTGFAASAISFSHICTSLMLVMASSILRIREPTTSPMVRMIRGSNSAVKRRMEARVSDS